MLFVDGPLVSGILLLVDILLLFGRSLLFESLRIDFHLAESLDMPLVGEMMSLLDHSYAVVVRW